MESLKIYFLVDTLVPERCAIFCWQVMKMFHPFLTSGNLKYTLKIFSCRRLHDCERKKYSCNPIFMIFWHGIFKNLLFSGHSCAKKMRHLLLEGYEDIPSFLNQWKLKVYIQNILMVAPDSLTANRITYLYPKYMYMIFLHGMFKNILLVDSLVPERCTIFCWQVMKMFHLSLTSRNLKYTLKIFLWQHLAGKGKSVAVAL